MISVYHNRHRATSLQGRLYSYGKRFWFRSTHILTSCENGGWAPPLAIRWGVAPWSIGDLIDEAWLDMALFNNAQVGRNVGKPNGQKKEAL